IDLSQYRDLEAFAQFGSDLDAETQATLNRGERLVEALNQDELKPWPVEDEVAAIYSGTAGYLDRIKVERIGEFHQMMRERLHSENDELMKKIADGDWEEGTESALGEAIKDAIDDFGPDFDEEGNPLEEGESDRVKSKEERGKSGRTDGDDSDESDSDDEKSEDKEEAGATA
ncbi:MAG: F-type H+/Na+-transporting ATPase subunit alpha, partial [Thermoleophilaceae bacterium]|nr:F-type H+/Na+-transporting ATPase subunit alpha [Thermoleophilaceae bacterium]